VQALGLDFGGVDLIRTKNGEFIVCEVNSSPGLNDLNITRVVDEIKKWYQQTTQD
jgi:glutathione synthase/RimK-type ligase-like ATP-grasp enzyme